VLQRGKHFGCGAALLDTFDKSAGGLFEHGGPTDVAWWIAEVHRLGMRAVIAGSLTVETLARAAALRPDYVAVRGAACRGGRSGGLDARRIVALRRQLHRTVPWHGRLTHDDGRSASHADSSSILR
jgi:uncharacterized protein (UPF0264 family)